MVNKKGSKYDKRWYGRKYIYNFLKKKEEYLKEKEQKLKKSMNGKSLFEFISNLSLSHITLIEETLLTNEYSIYPENYVREKFEKMGFLIEDMRNKGRGHPDFICEKNNRVIYLEVKANSDGLNLNQLKWMLENKDKKIIIYHLIKG